MRHRIHQERSRAATQEHGAHVGDACRQVELLTARIETLAAHLQTHQRDYHSRRGLLSLVNRRNRILGALARHDLPSALALAGRLGLRMAPPPENDHVERASS